MGPTALQEEGEGRKREHRVFLRETVINFSRNLKHPSTSFEEIEIGNWYRNVIIQRFYSESNNNV